MIKQTIIILAFISTNLLCLHAQETKNVLPGGDIHAPNDVVGNEEVPDVYTFPTNFKETIIVRLKHGTDLLEGLKKATAQNKIKNAVILGGIGSVY